MKKNVTIQMKESLEATPIAHLVQLANQYQSRIYLEMDSKKVNAKSIMGMMSLGLAAGEVVSVTAEGTDEEIAIESIEKYLNSQTV